MRTSGKTKELETIRKYMKGEMRTIIKPFNKEDKGKYVLSGFVMDTMEMIIGKLVQVRQKQGAFGTDLVLIREANGTLSSHTNQHFWIIPSEYKDELDKMFEGVYRDDADEYEYSIQGKEKMKGFLV